MGGFEDLVSISMYPGRVQMGLLTIAVICCSYTAKCLWVSCDIVSRGSNERPAQEMTHHLSVETSGDPPPLYTVNDMSVERTRTERLTKLASCFQGLRVTSLPVLVFAHEAELSRSCTIVSDPVRVQLQHGRTP